MKNILSFQINDGEKMDFAEVPQGEIFTLTIDKFPTEKELIEMEQKGAQYSLLKFTDKEGNSFKITSRQAND